MPGFAKSLNPAYLTAGVSMMRWLPLASNVYAHRQRCLAPPERSISPGANPAHKIAKEHSIQQQGDSVLSDCALQMTLAIYKFIYCIIAYEEN